MAKELVPNFSTYIASKEFGILESDGFSYVDFFDKINESLSDDNESSMMISKYKLIDDCLQKVIKSFNLLIDKGKREEGPDFSDFYFYSYWEKKDYLKNAAGMPLVMNPTSEGFDLKTYVSKSEKGGRWRFTKQAVLGEVTYHFDIASGNATLISVNCGYMPEKFNYGVHDELAEISNLAERYYKEQSERPHVLDGSHYQNFAGHGGKITDSSLSRDYHNGEWDYNKMKEPFPTTEMMEEYVGLMNQSICDEANAELGIEKEINSLPAGPEKTNLKYIKAAWDKLKTAGLDLSKETVDSLESVRKSKGIAKKDIKYILSNLDKFQPKNVSIFDKTYNKHQERQFGYDPESKSSFIRVKAGGDYVYYKLDENEAVLVANNGSNEELKRAYQTLPGASLDGNKYEIDDITSRGYPETIKSTSEMTILYKDMLDRCMRWLSGDYEADSAGWSGELERTRNEMERNEREFADKTSEEDKETEAYGEAQRRDGKPNIIPDESQKDKDERVAANESFDLFNYIAKNF